MYKKYNLNNSDLRLTKNHNIKIGKYVDYRKQVCKKPWGYESLAYINTKLGIWILHIKKNCGTSIHTHFKKDTFFHEVTKGPFDRNDTINASWAPDEKEKSMVISYFDKINKIIESSNS